MASDHHDFDQLLAGYVLGDLQDDELLMLRESLASDPQLQRQLDDLQLTLQLLPMGLSADASPPARLRRRLLNHGTRSELVSSRFRGLPARLTSRLPAAALAVLTAAVSMLAVQVIHLQKELAAVLSRSPSPSAVADATPPAAPRVLLLRSSNHLNPDLSGELLVAPDRGHNQLAIRGLPAPPPAHAYRLWATTNGMTKGCVRFVPNADGTVSMPIPSQPTSEAQILTITLEPLLPDGSVPKGPQLLTSV